MASLVIGNKNQQEKGQHQNGNSILLTVAGALAAVGYVGFCRYRREMKRKKEKKPFEDLPMPPNPHWLKGHRGHLQGDMRVSLKRWLQGYANQHGQVGIWVRNMPTVVVMNWEDARLILRNETSRKRIFAYDKHLNNFLGARNIGTLKGREWKVHRSAILRSFAPTTVDKSRKIVAGVTRTAVESLQDRIRELSTSSRGPNEKQQDFTIIVEQLAKMITVDIFGKVALSKDFECTKYLSPSPLAQAFDYLGNELTRRLKSPFRPDNFFYWIPTPNNIKHRKERSLLTSFLKEIIEERNKLPASNHERSDLLSELISTFDKNDDPMSDGALLDTLLSLLFAGYDTVSVTLSYALFLVSQHPLVEEVIMNEINAAKSLDNQDELKYCEAVIYETLRLYPPATTTTRYLQKPLTLNGGLVVEANTLVYVSIWLVQHHSRHFPEPEEFRPDRWVKKQMGGKWVDREEDDQSGTIAAANRNAFLAFSAGARSCGAQNFALQESVIVLANLLKSLRFAPAEGYELIPVRRGIIQSPKDGIPMIVQERS